MRLALELRGVACLDLLDHKFITEDVPTGLVPMSAIGAATGVKTPAIDALVEMVRNMTGRDFAAEGARLSAWGRRWTR
jgi:opine dehydrogenase